MPNSPLSSESTPYANWKLSGLSWRGIAFFIDSTAYSCIVTLIFSAAFYFGGEQFLSEIFVKLYQNPSPSLDIFGMQEGLALLVCSLSAILILLLYGTITEGSQLAATPGKLIMGLRVSTTEGEPLLLSDSFARNLYKNLAPVGFTVISLLAIPLAMASPLLGGIAAIASLILGLLLCAYGVLDPLWALLSNSNQALHDYFSGSLVVKQAGVNRLLRLILALILIVALSVVQIGSIALAVGPVLTPFIDQLQALSADFSPTGEKQLLRSPITYTRGNNIPSVSERIAQELAKANEGIEKALPKELQISTTPKKPKRAPLSTTLKKRKTDHTPFVDGASVLSKKNRMKKGIVENIPKKEHFSGAIKIGNTTFTIQDVVASLSETRKVIVLNFYDTALSAGDKSAMQHDIHRALSDTRAVLRLKLILSKYGNTCSDSSLKKYIIDVNTRASGIAYKDTFFSFKRGGNQIISKEYVSFECLREPGGHLSAELRGTTGFLIGGVRVPVRWNTKLTALFPGG